MTILCEIYFKISWTKLLYIEWITFLCDHESLHSFPSVCVPVLLSREVAAVVPCSCSCYESNHIPYSGTLHSYIWQTKTSMWSKIPIIHYEICHLLWISNRKYKNPKCGFSKYFIHKNWLKLVRIEIFWDDPYTFLITSVSNANI